MKSEFQVAEHHEAEASHSEAELTEELGHEEPGAHDTPFPPFDPDYFMPQFVWLVLTFGLLYLLMSRLALPRVAGVIEARRERIAGDLDKAADLKEQTDEAISEYEKALSDARATAHNIAAETRDSMKSETDEMRADMDAKLEADISAAEKRIAETKDKALANVREVASETAAVIVQHLTGDAADAQALAGAVDNALSGALEGGRA